MGIQAPAEVKFQLIQEATRKDGNELSISSLCLIAGVSRSGYYSWINATAKRHAREEKDLADFVLIKQAYEYRGYKKGARGIHMRLLHQVHPVIMNPKKIRRLMKKFGLSCPIRRENPYRRMAQATKTSHVSGNLLNREFKKYQARQVFLTDITYLKHKGGVCYLSSIMDVCTHEILSYELSDNLRVDFVLRTIDKILEKHGAELDDDVIVHSDQGFHYTSKAFIEKLHDAEFIQSMSRKGNCWDNSPQESFFGHMKDEISEQLAACHSFEDVKRLINDWMDYYNHDRYQWELKMLSPCEYYQYILTGVYPITNGVSKNPRCSRGSAPDPGV